MRTDFPKWEQFQKSQFLNTIPLQIKNVICFQSFPTRNNPVIFSEIKITVSSTAIHMKVSPETIPYKSNDNNDEILYINSKLSIPINI